MSAFLRKYNTLLVTGATAIRIPLVKRGAVDFAVGADWTPATGDVKVRTDNDAVANITNLPTAVAMGNTAEWEFILTAAELSGKQITVTIADSATKAVEDQMFIVETFGNASAMYPSDLSASILSVNTTQVAGTAQTAGDLAALITAVDDLVDTEVAAIKAKTDNLPAAPAAVSDIPTAAVVADAVWDEARSGHTTTGTFGESYAAIVAGSCITGTLTTTAATTDLTEATDDHYIGRTIVWITGVLAGQASAITDYAGATKTLTYALVTDAPSNGDRFVLV